jgi:hypothetical protein
MHCLGGGAGATCSSCELSELTPIPTGGANRASADLCPTERNGASRGHTCLPERSFVCRCDEAKNRERGRAKNTSVILCVTTSCEEGAIETTDLKLLRQGAKIYFRVYTRIQAPLAQLVEGKARKALPIYREQVVVGGRNDMRP